MNEHRTEDEKKGARNVCAACKEEVRLVGRLLTFSGGGTDGMHVENTMQIPGNHDRPTAHFVIRRQRDTRRAGPKSHILRRKSASPLRGTESTRCLQKRKVVPHVGTHIRLARVRILRMGDTGPLMRCIRAPDASRWLQTTSLSSWCRRCTPQGAASADLAPSPIWSVLWLPFGSAYRARHRQLPLASLAPQLHWGPKRPQDLWA